MSESAASFSIEELAERAGVPVRTVRYYVSEGLLPGPVGRGRQAEYTADHLARLLLIRRLVAQRVPLGEQRRRLERLSDADVRALLAEAEREAQALRVAEASPSPREYVAALLRRAQAAHEWPTPPPPREPGAPPPWWLPIPSPVETDAEPNEAGGDTYRRVELAPGVELHISSDAERRERELIDRLIALAERRRYRGRR